MNGWKNIILSIVLSIFLTSPCFAGGKGVSGVGCGMGVAAAGGAQTYCTGVATCNTPPTQDGIVEVCQNTFDIRSTTSITHDFEAVNSASNLCSGTTSTNSFSIEYDADDDGGEFKIFLENISTDDDTTPAGCN